MSRLTEVKLPILVRMASIVVHVEEYLSADGHPYDRVALEQLVADPEMQAYLDELRKAGFLPVKRGG